MLAGVSCLAVTLFFCLCFNVSLEQSNMKFNSRKSIKYSSVSVFPFIKREIAKFEDRERDVVLKVESVWVDSLIKSFFESSSSPNGPQKCDSNFTTENSFIVNKFLYFIRLKLLKIPPKMTLHKNLKGIIINCEHHLLISLLFLLCMIVQLVYKKRSLYLSWTDSF